MEKIKQIKENCTYDVRSEKPWAAILNRVGRVDFTGEVTCGTANRIP